MVCNICGKIIEEDSKFCRFCGVIVTDSRKVLSRQISLNSKSKEELIRIILRKDKSERSCNKKIQELVQELNNLKNAEKK